MIRLGDVIEWKYGPVADTEGNSGDEKIISWRHPSIEQPDEVQILADRKEYIAYLASTLYQKKREAEYPPIEDQLDLILKTLVYIKAGGIDVGPDGDTFISKIQAVKDKYPKVT